jgi:hypothetical protein
MAGDQFTQISNGLFRDPNLSAKAKGIFGFISTHREGWGVTPESIAAYMSDGVSAINSGLRELEAYGYLHRDQPRRANGTLGPIVYYITDMPSSGPVVENRAPDVTCENSDTDGSDGHLRRSDPVVDFPRAADPRAADRPHKKTSSKYTNEENTTSPSAPLAAAPSMVAEDLGGGGGDAPPMEGKDTAAAAFVDRLPYGARLPGPRQRDYLIERVSAALAAGWTEWALRVQLTEETDSAKSLAAVYRHRLEPENLPAAPPLPKPREGDDGPLSEVSGSLYVKCLGSSCGHRKMLPTEDGLCRDCREDVSA